MRGSAIAFAILFVGFVELWTVNREKGTAVCGGWCALFSLVCIFMGW